MTVAVPPELRDHPDRRRWNARYREAPPPVFEPHPLVTEAARARYPAGPVLELACGRSGSALALAASQRDVFAVDISDIALDQLATEAAQRGLANTITTVIADVPTYCPGQARFALVLATHYWDEQAFRTGCEALVDGGLIAWEAVARGPGAEPQVERPWEIEPDSMSARLPPGFDVLDERTVDRGGKLSTRILARRDQHESVAFAQGQQLDVPSPDLLAAAIDAALSSSIDYDSGDPDKVPRVEAVEDDESNRG